MASEDSALEAVGRFLVLVEKNGLSCFSEEGIHSVECRRFFDALEILRGSGSPCNQRLAKMIVSAFYLSFEPAIGECQKSLDNGAGAGNSEDLETSLLRLYDGFKALEVMVNRVCDLLSSPGLTCLIGMRTRYKLLQSDLLDEGETQARIHLFRFLRHHWIKLFQKIERMEVTEMSSTEMVASDKVMQCLHGLTLSGTREIQRLVMEVVVGLVHDKIEELDDDYSQRRLEGYLAWEEKVVEPFLRAARPPQSDKTKNGIETGSMDSWSEAIQHKLRLMFTRKRLKSFWNIIVDFPDSVPTLEDLRMCMQLDASVLREELIGTVRCLFAQRLHRAGARTEDIVEMLIKTVYSLYIVFSRSEQSSIFSTIGDTLAHIGKRKDCAAAVVQSINQLSEFNNPRYAPKRTDQPGEEASEINRDPPDFFKVLSTVIPVSELVRGYREMLASQLLSKDLHDFDTTNEDEVFERLKSSIGERNLSNCMVMLRDMRASRRISLRLIHNIKDSLIPPTALHILVISRVAWPERLQTLRVSEVAALPSAFRVHESLLDAMNRVGEAFHSAIPNQKLHWHLPLGRVKIHIHQKNPVTDTIEVVPFIVSLFSASILLYVRELDKLKGGATSGDVADKLGVDLKLLEGYLTTMIPRMITVRNNLIHVQTVLAAQSCDAAVGGVTGEDGQDEEGAAGLEPGHALQLQKMVLALLRAATRKSIHEIHNSLKQFASFPCTLGDVKLILKSLLEGGKIVAVDGGYSLRR